MSEKKIKILHLEDVEVDADLVEWQLKKGNFDFDLLVVEDRDSYINALHSFSPDVIISDHSLPSFNSVDALKIKNEWNRDIPFILVTATVSEEFAVNMMKDGASDYILKDRMERLPSSVINCMDKFTSDQEKMIAQKQLVESQANLKAILDNTDTGYILISPEFLIASFNQRALDLAQFQFEKPLQKGSFALDFFENDRKDRVAEVLEAALRGEKVDYEISYIQPDESYRWFHVSYSGIANADMKMIGVIMSITDINKRKLSEIEKDRITADLIRRNTSMEQFSYIVSHNLRAPVSSILGLEYLLRTSELTDDESKEIHCAISEATDNLDKIVKDLNEILQVTQYESEQLTDVSLSDLIENIQESLGQTIKKAKATLDCDFSRLTSLRAVRSNLYSIFHNLILNSIKFHREGVDPVINIKSDVNGDRLLFYFKDNGQGIDLPKHGKSLFELYNKVNSSSSGRGMGLFMVKTQVELLNGNITVSSKSGRGTQFLISLPRSSENA